MDYEALQSYESNERIKPVVEAALEMGLFSSHKTFFPVYQTLMLVMLLYSPLN
jgi:hypothetical protein